MIFACHDSEAKAMIEWADVERERQELKAKYRR